MFKIKEKLVKRNIDFNELKGISGKKVLYVVTLHTINTTKNVVSFSINVNWRDAHPDIILYLTEVLRDIALGQQSFMKIGEQCVMVTCVFVPTFMTPHLTKKLFEKKIQCTNPKSENMWD